MGREDESKVIGRKKFEERVRNVLQERESKKNSEPASYIELDKIAEIDAKIDDIERSKPFDPQREFKKIGSGHYREMENFFKDLEKKEGNPYNDLELVKSIKQVSGYEDQILLDIYQHSNIANWSEYGSREYYKAILEEVRKRYSNK